MRHDSHLRALLLCLGLLACYSPPPYAVTAVGCPTAWTRTQGGSGTYSLCHPATVQHLVENGRDSWLDTSTPPGYPRSYLEGWRTSGNTAPQLQHLAVEDDGIRVIDSVPVSNRCVSHCLRYEALRVDSVRLDGRTLQRQKATLSGTYAHYEKVPVTQLVLAVGPREWLALRFLATSSRGDSLLTAMVQTVRWAIAVGAHGEEPPNQRMDADGARP